MFSIELSYKEKLMFLNFFSFSCFFSLWTFLKYIGLLLLVTIHGKLNERMKRLVERDYINKFIPRGANVVIVGRLDRCSWGILHNEFNSFLMYIVLCRSVMLFVVGVLF